MLSEEAARARGERDEGDDPALVLGEMLKCKVPGGFEDDVHLVHPAVLWVLDHDKDGRFSDDDVHAFAEMMGEYTKMWLREEVRIGEAEAQARPRGMGGKGGEFDEDDGDGMEREISPFVLRWGRG